MSSPSPIPAFDLSQQFGQIRDQVNAAALELLASGRYIGGAAVAEFEAAFARYIGTEEAVGCNSGTDALYLALRVLGVGPGDEVITVSFTFIATAEMISAVGARPVFVEVEAESFNLDPTQLEAAITPRTKAIIPVHLFGRPVNMEPVLAIARRHNLVVIEDCAQATGATWGEQRVGSLGDIGCFSFYPTKNLGACGDGGVLTLNQSHWAAEARMLREHGSRERYYHEAVGVNSRLDALQAKILTLKLNYLDQWNAQRRAIAERYGELLAGVSDLELPSEAAGGQAVWNQYTVKVGSGKDATTRDGLREHLQAQGIGSAIYYPLPLHLQKVYRDLGYLPGSLPVTERVAHQVLSLPMFPELSPEEQGRVAAAIQGFVA